MSERFIPFWPTSSETTEVEKEHSIEDCQDQKQARDDSMALACINNDELQLEQHPAHYPSPAPFTLPYTSNDVTYVPYESELQMPDIVHLMKASLSEPYSIYTYRYFIHNWPQLCVLAHCQGRSVGAIVCKLERHHFNVRRGYIAMLAVDKDFRKRKIGSTLVRMSIWQMLGIGCDEVVLETEVTNQSALSLYENLGFVRDKYLHQYYLNGVDAFRLKLWLRDPHKDAV